MVDLVSSFAAKVGQLVVNLATRPGLHVSLGIVDSVINNQVLNLKLTVIKNGRSASISETLTEAAIEGISDIGTVADALHGKVLKLL